MLSSPTVLCEIGLQQITFLDSRRFLDSSTSLQAKLFIFFTVAARESHTRGSTHLPRGGGFKEYHPEKRGKIS